MLSELPIVQAPMGGGPSTPELAAAVGEAGGLGFLAAGYRSVAAVRADIAALRGLSRRPFGINLFAPPAEPGEPAEIASYAEELRGDAERRGVELGEPRHDDDGWEEKLALCADERVPLVSFTFGCPDAAVLRRLHAAGCSTWVTVTTPAEAAAATRAGAGALVVQGVEAGGHRGSYDPAQPGELGLLALLQLVRAETGLPLVSTGGIADAAAVRAVLAAGASAAQLGTAFMLTPEAGTSEAHRRALRGSERTVLTRAFTGRLARGIENRFIREHEHAAPLGYPEVHHLTAPLRAAARAEGDPDGLNLWAGEAYALTREQSAAELVRSLAAQVA
jgi:nitronate monooxygenase